MVRLYERFLTTGSGGNASCRLADGRVAITPGGRDKGCLTAGDILLLGADGTVLEGEGKPSMEAALHLAVYRTRPEVGGVVHAHPALATYYTLPGAGRLRTDLTGEGWALLGEPVLAPYALMGTQDLAAVVAEAVQRGVCVLMEHHGALCVGCSPEEAFARMETLEASARLSHLADGRNLPSLGQGQKEAIDRLMGR